MIPYRRFLSVLPALAVVAALALPPLGSVAHAQHHGDGHEDNRVWGANRALASRFTNDKVDAMIFDTRLRPRWLEGDANDRFWYTWEDSSGKTFWIVDPVRGTKETIFDNADMARQLT